MFFYILYKRTRGSLRSFMFFIKECKRTLCSFWFHKSYKNYKSCKKKNLKERSVLFIRFKKNLTFFFQYIFIYISAFFYKEHKITQRTQRSFIKKVKERKECSVLFKKNARMFRSFEKNAKERIRTRERCVLLKRTDAQP